MSGVNRYTIAFSFKGKYHYLTFDANAFTNNMFPGILGDAIYDMCEEHDQWLMHTIEVDGKKYKVTFDIYTSMSLSVYEIYMDGDGEENENRVASGIPYTVIKIENGKDRIFELSDVV